MRIVAAELGLQVSPGGLVRWPGVVGYSAAGIAVKLEHQNKRIGWIKRRYAKIEAQGALPISLKLSSEGVGSVFKKLIKSGELQIGDPVFDQANYLEGNELEILASLSYRAPPAYVG